MIKDSIAYIANHFWMESIKNLSNYLSELEREHFSNNDYYYLTTIYYMDKPNFSQVAEALKLTKPAISVFIGRLVKMGLVEKIQSEEDRRMFYISVTEKGKGIIEGDEKLYEGFDKLVQELIPDKDQYDRVDELLSQMVTRLTTESIKNR